MASDQKNPPLALEFFAGIGLARIGLQQGGIDVSWANDYEPAKHQLYERHFGAGHFHLGDVSEVSAASLPKNASLAWSSSPCTDLSLAGSRGGLSAGESSAFWQFIRVLTDLGADRPAMVVLENVVGLGTSHGGDDIAAAIRAFNALGYSVDVLMIDAKRFLPHSRPRLFIVGSVSAPDSVADVESVLRPSWLGWIYADPTLRTHRMGLPAVPDLLSTGFSELVKTSAGNEVEWWGHERNAAFENSLSPIQYERMIALRQREEIVYRTAYRRTRGGVATWEMRPDDIAGCLRTARGGSSKQAVVELGGGQMRARWMTPLECAALMGASDFNLGDTRVNQALFAFGDAVAVPVVRWLAENYLLPVLAINDGSSSVAKA